MEKTSALATPQHPNKLKKSTCKNNVDTETNVPIVIDDYDDDLISCFVSSDDDDDDSDYKSINSTVSTMNSINSVDDLSKMNTGSDSNCDSACSTDADWISTMIDEALQLSDYNLDDFELDLDNQTIFDDEILPDAQNRKPPVITSEQQQQQPLPPIDSIITLYPNFTTPPPSTSSTDDACESTYIYSILPTSIHNDSNLELNVYPSVKNLLRKCKTKSSTSLPKLLDRYHKRLLAKRSRVSSCKPALNSIHKWYNQNFNTFYRNKVFIEQLLKYQETMEKDLRLVYNLMSQLT